MATKVALVTGANQGIGLALVRRFCKEHPDWIVYGTSRSVANGEEACKKLKEEGLTARFVEADITKPETITALKKMLVKEHGGLDILINNAGTVRERGSTEPMIIRAEEVINTNVFGTYLVCEQLIPILKDGARVVIMSSRQATVGLHRVKRTCPARYQTFIKNDPPISVEDVMQSMRDFLNSVQTGTYVSEQWAEGEADFAGTKWEDDAAFQMSKTGITLFVRAYQHHFDSSAPERDIVFTATNPGWCKTALSRFTGTFTPEEGADTPYYAATLPAGTTIRGQLLNLRQIVPWE